MYPPPHHLEDDPEHLYRLIEAYSLATLISPAGDDVLVTHLPLIPDRRAGAAGLLRGHIDRENPQAALLDDRPATAVFQGPNCYISPTVYSTSQLPTWNYVIVHVRGHARHMESPQELRASIVRMIEFLEPPEGGFSLADDDPRVAALLPHIVGFEIEIAEMSGRFKLSQDKSAEDRELAKERLLATAGESLRDFLDSVL